MGFLIGFLVFGLIVLGMDFSFGPIALTNTYTTNLFNPGTTTGGVNCTSSPYDKLNVRVDQLMVVNKTAGSVTVRMYKGLTGANTAGTEIWYDYPVPADNWVDKWGIGRFASADFLVGGASAGTSLGLVGNGVIDVGA